MSKRMNREYYLNSAESSIRYDAKVNGWRIHELERVWAEGTRYEGSIIVLMYMPKTQLQFSLVEKPFWSVWGKRVYSDAGSMTRVTQPATLKPKSFNNREDAKRHYNRLIKKEQQPSKSKKQR